MVRPACVNSQRAALPTAPAVVAAVADTRAAARISTVLRQRISAQHGRRDGAAALGVDRCGPPARLPFVGGGRLLIAVCCSIIGTRGTDVHASPRPGRRPAAARAARSGAACNLMIFTYAGILDLVVYVDSDPAIPARARRASCWLVATAAVASVA